MQKPSTFLVFGATGGTGKHFVSQVLAKGHKVRALVRNPSKVQIEDPNLQVLQGSITDVTNVDELVQGSDFVILMLGDINLQRHTKINTAFVKQLVPAMRRQGVKRFLYQAGGLSTPYKERLSPYLWILRHTMGRAYAGQHEDNEAVMEYLHEDAKDIQWIVHRAGIGSDRPSQGVLKRSRTQYSVATFADCADYNFRIIMDEDAIHTSHHSYYA